MTTAPPPSSLAPFRYEAQTPDGRTFRGTLDGISIEDVQNRLSQLQLRILAVEAAPPAKPSTRRALGREDFVLFNQQLAHLTAAGLPVERGLRLIAADFRSGRLSRAAADVATDLENGTPLREAFDRHAQGFPPLYARLVDAGVHAGNLPAMLFNLGRHLELVTRLHQALWRVLSYPLMVLAAASLVFYFISTVVLPHFGTLYHDFKLQLPPITRIFLAIGDVYPMLFYTLVIAVLLFVIITLVMRARGRGNLFLESILIHLPLIGGVVRASLLSRWVDALRIGIEAGLDLPRAIALASDATASPRIVTEGNHLASLVSSGTPLSQFRGNLIPQTVPAALELGASTGDLPVTLATLSDLYEQQAEHRLRLLPSIFTPLLMFIIAIVISLAIAALFTPIIQYIRALSAF